MSADRAHDDAHAPREDVARPRRGVKRDDGQAAAAVASGQFSRLSPAMLSRLQRSVGSRAISRALSAGDFAVQRLAHGGELSSVNEKAAAEVTKKAAATPASTSAARGLKRVTLPPKLKRVGATLAGAQAVLQRVFGKTKKIVPGTMVILSEAALYAKYDEFAIAEGTKRADGSAWKPGDTAKYDEAAGVRMFGFARNGTIYITEGVDLHGTAHEMLHVNTSANFHDTVGGAFDEGATEYLAQKAVKDAGMPVDPTETGYQVQVELTKLLVDLVGEPTLVKAYFDDPKHLVSAYLSKGSKPWDELHAAAEALDTAGVKEALKPKGGRR